MSKWSYFSKDDDKKRYDSWKKYDSWRSDDRKSFWDKYDSDSEYSSSTSYWLKGNLFSKSKEKGHDYIALSKYLRAVGNYVHIWTGKKDISVTYTTDGTSYTDGKKRVFLSASINEKDFDSNVGLALHEASHILYTDVDYIQANVWKDFNGLGDKVLKSNGKPFTTASKKLTKVMKDNGITEPDRFFHAIMNVIEDLYIDAIAYAEAVGYRNYYKALYQKFFGNIEIVKGFYDPKFAMPTPDNYMFHFINMRNPNRNLSALPKLDEIWTALDLRNIRRLSTQQDRIDLSLVVLSLMLQGLSENSIPQNPMGDPSGDPNGKVDGDPSGDPNGKVDGNPTGKVDGDPTGKVDGNPTGKVDGNPMGDPTGKVDGNPTGKVDGNPSGRGGQTPTNQIELNDSNQIKQSEQNGMERVDVDSLKDLTNSEIETLEKIIQRQKELILDQINKTKVSQETMQKITAVDEIDMDIKTVAKEFSKKVSGKADGIKTVVVNSINKNFIKSPLASSFGIRDYMETDIKVIEDGIRLGKLLANKIKVRNEERTQTNTRLNSGKIDARLLNEVGFKNFSIFKKITTHAYKESYIHISIDQSGSMQGDKFTQAMKFATMIATASKYIKNLRVVVSTRTIANGGGDTINGKPFIMTIFDSKINDVSHMKAVFPHVRATGSTPEGITFEAIQNEIMKDSANTDAYFINICDGQPGFTYYDGDVRISYSGQLAEEHSRQQIDKMRMSGINTMTYFIGSGSEFQYVLKTYVKNCHHIKSASQITEVAKVLNKELLNGSKVSK